MSQIAAAALIAGSQLIASRRNRGSNRVRRAQGALLAREEEELRKRSERQARLEGFSADLLAGRFASPEAERIRQDLEESQRRALLEETQDPEILRQVLENVETGSAAPGGRSNIARRQFFGEQSRAMAGLRSQQLADRLSRIERQQTQGLSILGGLPIQTGTGDIASRLSELDFTRERVRSERAELESSLGELLAVIGAQPLSSGVSSLFRRRLPFTLESGEQATIRRGGRQPLFEGTDSSGITFE